MRPIDADLFKELVLSKIETDPYIVAIMINAIDAMPTMKMGRADRDTKGTSNKMP